MIEEIKNPDDQLHPVIQLQASKSGQLEWVLAPNIPFSFPFAHLLVASEILRSMAMNLITQGNQGPAVLQAQGLDQILQRLLKGKMGN